jgi:GT2 family glycosyltransferase
MPSLANTRTLPHNLVLMNDAPVAEAPVLLDVLIPVYGNLHLVEKCLVSLAQQIYSGNHAARIIVIDDGMNSYQGAELLHLCVDRGVELWRSPINLGFRCIVNSGYELCTSEWVLLLNSDVELPPAAVTELVNIGVSDPKVALVSPFATNGSPLEAALEPGQNWRELSIQFATNFPPSIDACTTVGYCLLIRRSAINSETLFSDQLPDAYGEDTDLHFRMTAAGWKAVAATRVYVYHQGSASYAEHENIESLRHNARAHFDANWHSTWIEQHPVFEKVLESTLALRSGMQLAPRWESRRDVVMVSPGHRHVANGGVSTIWALAEASSQSTALTSVVSLDLAPGDEPPWDGSHLRATSLARIESSKITVATAPWTWNAASGIAAQSGGKLVTFMQGLDFYMNPEVTHNYLDMIKASTAVLTTSDYLEAFAWEMGASQVIRVNIEPNPYLFFQSIRDANLDVIIVTRDTGLKGSEVARGSAALLAARGFRVAALGSSDSIQIPGVEHIPWVPKSRLASVLSRAKIVFDPSVTEGFGLIPRESAAVGAGIIVARSGGVEDDFRRHPGVRILERPADPIEMLRTVEGLLSWYDTTPKSKRALRPQGPNFTPWQKWLEENLR